MPQVPVEENSRLALRIRPDEKATLMRAAALTHTDLTTFVLQNVLAAARSVIEQDERIQLSGRDSLRVLDLLENPPDPNEKLQAAARSLPKE